MCDILEEGKLARPTAFRPFWSGSQKFQKWLTPKTHWTLSPDEEDNRLLECAQSANADCLVTGNRKHFPDRIGDARILTPREFLTELGF